MTTSDTATAEISIIIATHNRRHYLEDCLASVVAQKGPSWEAIVVDDCSVDDTWSFLSAYPDPRVHVVRLESPSERSVARNRGLSLAHGRWVLFLDDDDLLSPNALEHLVAAVLQHPGVIAATGTLRTFGTNPTKAEYWPKRTTRLSMFLPNVAEPIVGVNRSILRREEVLAIGGFDPGLHEHEDYIFALQLTARGQVVIVPKVVLQHRLHARQTPRGLGDLRGPLVRKLEGTLAPAQFRSAINRFETQRRQAVAAGTAPATRLGPALKTLRWILTHDRKVFTSPFSRYHIAGGTSKLLVTGLLRREI